MMTRRCPPRHLPAILAICLGLLGGCAADPKPFEPTPAANYPYHAVQEGVAIGAEPWNQSSQMNALFHHTPQKPVIAMRLTIYNGGATTIRFSHTSAELVGPKGAVLHVVPPGEMAERVYDDGSAAAGVVTIVTLGYGGAIGGAIMGASSDASLKDQHNVQQGKMDLVLLDPGQQMTGFLFFDDNDTHLLRDHPKDPVTLRLNQIPRSHGDDLRFEFPSMSLLEGPTR